MKRKMFLLPLLLAVMLGSVVIPASASDPDHMNPATVGGYVYGFKRTYLADCGGGEDGLQIDAYTTNMTADKIKVAYWDVLDSGNVYTLPVHPAQILLTNNGTHMVATVIICEPDYCEDWLVKVHFQGLGVDSEGSWWVWDVQHVPWFTSLPVAMLASIGGIAYLKRRKKI